MCLDSVVAIVAYNISQTFLENSVEFRVFDRVKFESAVYHRKTPAFEMLLLKNIPTFFLRITIQEGSKQFSSPLSKCFSIFLWFFKWYGVDGRSFEVCAAVKESSVFVGLLTNNLIPYTLQIPENLQTGSTFVGITNVMAVKLVWRITEVYCQQNAGT